MASKIIFGKSISRQLPRTLDFQNDLIQNARLSFPTWVHLGKKSFQIVSILPYEHQKEVSYGNNSFNTGRFTGL